MAKAPSKIKSFRDIGVSGRNVHNGTIRGDEFLRELKGNKAIQKFREMRDNDSTVGAVMYAVEQILRDVDITVEATDDSAEAKGAAEFLTECLDDMEHTMDDHISEALSFLTFGFQWTEVVYKRRGGWNTNSPKKHSKYSDGKIGIRKLASRAPWTIDRFDIDRKSGDILGVWQNVSVGANNDNYIPSNKSILYRTTVINGDPSGRSILRNAYTAYEYLSNLQAIEAIAMERELAGIPVGKVPSEYLAADATDDQVALINEFKQALRDVKFNEQGYLLLPSDTFMDHEGKPSNIPLMDISLMSTSGTRAVEIDPVVKRYQHDIARSILSEFLMLGSSERGSFALSKSKSDLFLRALESYITTIVDVLNKQLVPMLWKLNKMPVETMPKIVAGDVAPHDLKELGAYLRNLNGANINLSDQPEIVDALLHNAELPELDREKYEESLEVARQAALAPVQEGESEEEDEEEDQDDSEEDSTSKALDLELKKAILEDLKR